MFPWRASEELQKIAVRIANIPAETRREDIPYTSQEFYCLIQMSFTDIICIMQILRKIGTQYSNHAQVRKKNKKKTCKSFHLGDKYA
jgi:glutaminase